MKRLMFFLCSMCALTVFAFAESPEEIVRASREQADIKTIGTRAKMEIQRDGKTLNVLVVDQFTQRGADGSQKTFIELHSPANVKGTRVLMIQNAGSAPDQRIYLPALGKVRRIAAASEGSESFMGTDFSYNDISFMSRPVNLDTYTLLKEEEYEGKACYVVQAVPKDAGYEYSKTVLWIEKEKKMLVKAEMYERKGTLAKILTMSDYKTVDGILTPMTTKIATLAAKTSTTIRFEIMQYNKTIPDKVFTTQYLEKGR